MPGPGAMSRPHALRSSRLTHRIFGGATERERRELLRRAPATCGDGRTVDPRYTESHRDHGPASAPRRVSRTTGAIIDVTAASWPDATNHRAKNTRRAITVSTQPRFAPSSPDTSLPLKLSSAIITADGSPVLGGLDVLLATTDKSRESAVNSPEEIPATKRLELHVNSVSLDSLPRLIHLSGRSLSAHHDEAAAPSYTLTLTFSGGSAADMFWSTTFEVPRSPLVDSRWLLTVPFSHSLTPAAPPCTR